MRVSPLAEPSQVLAWKRVPSCPGERAATGTWCDYRIVWAAQDGVAGYAVLVGGQWVDGSFCRTLGDAERLAERIEARR